MDCNSFAFWESLSNILFYLGGLGVCIAMMYWLRKQSQWTKQEMKQREIAHKEFHEWLMGQINNVLLERMLETRDYTIKSQRGIL